MPTPIELDFTALADGVVRNNVGVDGIRLWARGRLEADHFVFDATGQRLPLAAPAPGARGPWFEFAVTHFESTRSPRLQWLADSHTAGAPAMAPRSEGPSTAPR